MKNSIDEEGIDTKGNKTDSFIGQRRRIILALLCGVVTASASYSWGSGFTYFWSYLLGLVMTAFPILFIYGIVFVLSCIHDDIENNKYFAIIIIGVILFGYLLLVAKNVYY